MLYFNQITINVRPYACKCVWATIVKFCQSPVSSIHNTIKIKIHQNIPENVSKRIIIIYLTMKAVNLTVILKQNANKI